MSTIENLSTRITSVFLRVVHASPFLPSHLLEGQTISRVDPSRRYKKGALPPFQTSSSFLLFSSVASLSPSGHLILSTCSKAGSVTQAVSLFGLPYISTIHQGSPGPSLVQVTHLQSSTPKNLSFNHLSLSSSTCLSLKTGRFPQAASPQSCHQFLTKRSRTT